MTQLSRAKGGENHGRQWGVSLTVRRKEAGRTGQVESSPVKAFILLLRSESVFKASTSQGDTSKCCDQHGTIRLLLELSVSPKKIL